MKDIKNAGKLFRCEKKPYYDKPPYDNFDEKNIEYIREHICDKTVEQIVAPALEQRALVSRPLAACEITTTLASRRLVAEALLGR
ncbi:MAG: hypothetical protein LBT45_01450 [Rickettsiales bacterium]|jgi:hypothetical protein|nr:hypothetical protein [Rickettsiales bacterium]